MSRRSRVKRLPLSRAASCSPFATTSPLFRAWLDEHLRDRASKVDHHPLASGPTRRPCRLLQPNARPGPWADLLKSRLEIADKKYGLGQAKFLHRTDLFQPAEGDQMRLF
jgi:hypothetical protein